jgi:hypothetical protein
MSETWDKQFSLPMKLAPPPTVAVRSNHTKIQDELLDIIFDAYQPQRNRYALLSQHGRCTKRNAQHWLARTHVPRTVQLFELMANNPEIRRAVIALIGRMCHPN